ncbi:MAG: hypothetical protein AB7L09_21635 [Nitrospira sp.]
MPIRRFKPSRINFGTTARMSKYGGARQLRTQLDRLEKVIGAFAAHMHNEVPQVLEAALRPTFEKSQERVPKRTGALKRSGYLEVRKTPRGTEIEMGYARGGRPNYALLVHELPRYHKPPTTWKFLENPIKEDIGRIERDLVVGFGYASGVI